MLSRRRFLVSSGAAALFLPACGGGTDRSALLPTDPAVAAREAARTQEGAREISRSLTAGPVDLDLAGTVVKTWGFDGGPIAATAGDILEITLRNDLPEETTIHWHGIALRNDWTASTTSPSPRSRRELRIRIALSYPMPAPTSSTPTLASNSTAPCTNRW